MHSKNSSLSCYRNGHEKADDCAAGPTSNMEQVALDESMATNEVPTFDSRVNIYVHSVRGRLVDADGISAKAAIDGIVARGILRDDSPEFVEQVTFTQSKGDSESTTITIEEII
jgi:hypothetical protein